MTTFNEQLARLVSTVRSVTDHDVVLHSGEVYVNFDFDTALVIEPELTERGQRYHVTAMHWDRTHAVDMERDFGAFTLVTLPRFIAEFLEGERRAQERLAAILDGRPDD